MAGYERGKKWTRIEDLVRGAKWNLEEAIPFIADHIDDFKNWDDDNKGEILSCAYDALDNVKYLLSCVVDRDDMDKMTDV